jgi:probable phosphoglycerate mutase
MSCPDLLLLRHGETEWNLAGRMQGRMDSPLTAQGRAQAARQNALLRALPLSDFAAFASPQKRAADTAQIALAGLELVARHDARLVEIGMGAWTGLLRDDLRAAHPHLVEPSGSLDWYDHAPGGEGFAALEARCRAFLEDLTGPAVIVTHGITSRMLRIVATGSPVADLASLPGGQGVVHRVRRGRHETLA